jgi:hypothetical protein
MNTLRLLHLFVRNMAVIATGMHSIAVMCLDHSESFVIEGDEHNEHGCEVVGIRGNNEPSLIITTPPFPILTVFLLLYSHKYVLHHARFQMTKLCSLAPMAEKGL